MYGVLGEDKTDIEVIKVLIRRISKIENMKVLQRPYGGCGDLIKNGHKDIKTLKDLGCSRIIICYDSDKISPQKRYQEVVDEIISRSGVSVKYCVLVPVQEIEAWLLSDTSAVSKVISSVKITRKFASPENENNPKELLERLCRKPDSKPRYANTLHNKGIAEHLDLELLARTCPSSLPLFNIVLNGQPNYPRVTGNVSEKNVVDLLAKVKSLKTAAG
jgi:hypothetical protein